MAGCSADSRTRKDRSDGAHQLVPRDVHPIQSPVSWPAERLHYPVMIVGAGLAGAVLAERFASQAGNRVLLVDPRCRLADDDAEAIPEMIADPDVVDYLERVAQQDRPGGRKDLGRAGRLDLVAELLDHPNIDVLLGVHWREAQACYDHDHVLHTSDSGGQIRMARSGDVLAGEPRMTIVDGNGHGIAATISLALAAFHQVMAGDLSNASDEAERIASAA